MPETLEWQSHGNAREAQGQNLATNNEWVSHTLPPFWRVVLDTSILSRAGTFDQE
jgi:hypothetical protein